MSNEITQDPQMQVVNEIARQLRALNWQAGMPYKFNDFVGQDNTVHVTIKKTNKYHYKAVIVCRPTADEYAVRIFKINNDIYSDNYAQTLANDWVTTYASNLLHVIDYAYRNRNKQDWQDVTNDDYRLDPDGAPETAAPLAENEDMIVDPAMVNFVGDVFVFEQYGNLDATWAMDHMTTSKAAYNNWCAIDPATIGMSQEVYNAHKQIVWDEYNAWQKFYYSNVHASAAVAADLDAAWDNVQ